MEATNIFLQEVAVDGGRRPPINKLQRKLFVAIRKENLESVRSTLSSSQGKKCDLNCLDSSGKTVLQVAGDLNVSVRDDMIRALLSGGADLEFALLHAVHGGNIKTAKILLQFYDQQHQPSPHALCSLKSHAGYVTPLILAACLQNFQMVNLLLEHGFTIGDTKSAQRSSCSKRVASKKLGPAMYRLNEYRALASPVFIAASFLQNVQRGPGPVHRACVLNKELRVMAEQEYEFRKEYFELCDGCEEFAVALLNECRTMEEIRCVMDMDNKEETLSNLGKRSLNMLEFAINTKNKKFVSHPYSQLILNSEVYKNVTFLEKSAWKQTAVILLAFLLYPLVFMVWLVFVSIFPNHKVAKMFRSPCVTFLIHCGSYQTFLFLLALTSSGGSGSTFLGYSSIDWVILVFVIGYLVEVFKDVFQQGRVRYFSHYWSYLSVATVTSFGLHYIIWWTGRATLPGTVHPADWNNSPIKSSYRIMFSSECFITLGVLLAFIQNFSFIQANASTGPLLHAFIRMLKDVAKFFLYFVFVFLAFAVSYTKLYMQYTAAKEFLHQKYHKNTTDSLHPIGIGTSSSIIFWALFSEIELSTFKIKENGYDIIWKSGMTLFGAYNVVAVLVALNMLIAILNESYTRIMENMDTEWKFRRTKLWFTWIYKKGGLPSPFNILYVLLPLQWLMKRLFAACCSEAILLFFKKLINKTPKKIIRVTSFRRIDKQQRREVIRLLILRYLAKRSCHLETGTESSDVEEDNDPTVVTPNQQQKHHEDF